MIVNFDGVVLAHGTTGRVDEIITSQQHNYFSDNRH